MGECDNLNYDVTFISGTFEIGFSGLSILIIVAPITIVLGVGITIFLVKRKRKHERYSNDF